MKNYYSRIFLIVLFIALAVYFLYPTYQDYLNNQEISEVLSKKEQEIRSLNPSISRAELDNQLKYIADSIKASNVSFAEARLKRIKLGLDLQGGMRVVLEVNTAQLLKKLANSPDDKFNELIVKAEQEANTTDESVVDIMVRLFEQNNIRLTRYFGNIRDDDSKIISDLKTQTEDAVFRAEEIIRNRVDQYGVSEPSIQRQGTRRVIVELPGISNEEEARQLIQSTALLEFKLVKDPEFAFNIMQKIDEVLAGKVTPEGDTINNVDTSKKITDSVSTTDTAGQTPQMTEEQFKNEHPWFAVVYIDPQGQTADGYVTASNREKVQMLLSRSEVQRIIPNNIEFVFSAKPVAFNEGEAIYLLYCVNREPELTGGVITEAVATIDPNGTSAVVNMTMNTEGSIEWARITGANIDKRCAIVLDGVVYSSPVIRNKISGGRSLIEGMANLKEAQNLAIILNAGAFSAPVDIIEERTVGPSLGEDSVSDGLSSALLGFLAVAIFMIVYYRNAGGIASFSLIFTITFILGVLAAFGATLTLPGIAGIVLTIGMAVDANVLIYERIREELGTGKTLKASIEGGFSKASSAIWDSNITTLITCFILYQFGTGPIQGFALTLMIGVGTSLFGALVIAKVIFEILSGKGYKVSLG
ncbi:MAG: protein translocase subunit SecD [Ignavibacteriaceae bacterium]|nr:protein translocase subunit SecD [Ignavibacteriaceae bacterium]